jgi:isopentenyl phosphate kinase
MVKHRKKYIPSKMYVVINQYGEVFTGLQKGYPVYSSDWNQAKTLNKENTIFLMNEKGVESISEKEFYR